MAHRFRTRGALLRALVLSSLMLCMCTACAKQGTAAMTDKTFTDPAAAQLAQAAKSGNAALVRELVAGGANPNAQGEHGLTLLEWTMLQQSRQGFEALLAAGADPARGNDAGMTAVHLAAQADTPYWLETLLAKGANPDTPNTVTGAPPLYSALLAERGDNVQRLLTAGAHVDVADRQGQTPLHQAALINEPHWVLVFLQAGADPHAKDRSGATFQRYLFMSDDKLLNAATRRDLDRVRDWLRAHHIPIEDAHAG